MRTVNAESLMYLLCAIFFCNAVGQEDIDFESCNQSSSSKKIEGNQCELAMDKLFSQCGSNELSHTTLEPRAWWSGTLVVKAYIEQVMIIAKNDPRNFGRLRQFQIILDGGNVCAEHNKSRDAVVNDVFKCVGVSRTVMVKRNKYSYLSLCEVIVYGEPWSPDKNTSEYKEVKFKSCRQSTTPDRREGCEKAIDGTSDKYKCIQYAITRTKREANPYWVGFLEREVNVAKVRVIGRLNAYAFHTPRYFHITLDGGEKCAEHMKPRAVQDEEFACVGRSNIVMITMLNTTILSLCEIIAYRRITLAEHLEKYKIATVKCKKGFSYHAASKKCYQFTKVTTFTYDDAYEHCKVSGGRMVEPENWVTINHIKYHYDLIHNTCYFMGVVSVNHQFYLESQLNVRMTIKKNWINNEPNYIQSDKQLVVIMKVEDGPDFGKFLDVERNSRRCSTICVSDPI